VSTGDFAIIYLAFGAPFGVYRAYSSKETWYGVSLAIIAWPIIAVLLAMSTARRNSTSIQAELQAVRTELETRLLADSSPESIFEFREVFDRYTGLTLAARESSTPHVSALLELTGHPSPALAGSCIGRSEISKLQRHVSAARCEFASFLSQRRSEDAELAVQGLRELLGDTALIIPAPQPTVTREPLRAAAPVG